MFEIVEKPGSSYLCEEHSDNFVWGTRKHEFSGKSKYKWWEFSQLDTCYFEKCKLDMGRGNLYEYVFIRFGVEDPRAKHIWMMVSVNNILSLSPKCVTFFTNGYEVYETFPALNKSYDPYTQPVPEITNEQIIELVKQNL